LTSRQVLVGDTQQPQIMGREEEEAAKQQGSAFEDAGDESAFNCSGLYRR
jgi:hypothetical protein